MRRLRMLVGVVDPAIEDRVGTARESAVAVDADRHPSYGPNGGVADTLDEAKAAFRGHWGKARDHTSGLEVATASSYSDASMLVQSIKKRASLC